MAGLRGGDGTRKLLEHKRKVAVTTLAPSPHRGATEATRSGQLAPNRLCFATEFLTCHEFSMPQPVYLEVAIPTPLRRRFDYLPPAEAAPDEVKDWLPGTLLHLPFGQQSLVGVLLAIKQQSQATAEQLKPVLGRVEPRPAFTAELLDLCLWAADYYQSPVGEALHTALPALLRQGEVAVLSGEQGYRLTQEGKGLPQGALKRAAKQARLLELLQEREWISRSELEALGLNPTHARALLQKGLIEEH